MTQKWVPYFFFFLTLIIVCVFFFNCLYSLNNGRKLSEAYIVNSNTLVT